ncbi:Conserved_hypothetical protein [Hexamita inflata]|uniref:PATROL1-like C-terminal domain-containing protein n=1 Tax=Hexamita inflata TaxID=28002 RepID=A0AA86NJT5_9EUKA|nr:Conserved hypothetical protein [Hexamita inflata]
MQYDPLLNTQFDNMISYKHSGLAVQITDFLEQVFEDLDKVNMSKQSLNTLFSGLVQTFSILSENIKIPCYNFKPLLSSVFEGESTQKPQIKFSYQFDEREGFSSTELCFYLKNKSNQKRLDEQISININDIETINDIPQIMHKQDFTSLFQVLNKIKLQINTIDQIRQYMDQIFNNGVDKGFCHLVINKLINPIHEFSGVTQIQHSDLVKQYQTQILSQLDRILFNLMQFQANYSVFHGLRCYFQHLYCPTVKLGPIDSLIFMLKQILQFAQFEVAPKQRFQILECFTLQIAQAYRIILLDSGKRTRTFLHTDFEQIDTDLNQLKQLCRGFDFLNDRYYEFYPATDILSEADINKIFRRVDRAVTLHKNSSQQLIKVINTIEHDKLKEFLNDRDIDNVHPLEEFIRILNYRRYDEDTTRKFMQLLKKNM